MTTNVVKGLLGASILAGYLAGTAPLHADEQRSEEFWTGYSAFSASEYDPVQRVLDLGLTLEQVNRMVDRGLGTVDDCISPSGDEVGCSARNLSLS